ncbi:hypothetical protein B0A55_02158 [Friedmanniomyces simplex]|uniref:DUF6697 domain-containing protein n=1 Tax=Friedmanniomyces simplex TaxID=329884 RepID=A0A4U0Y191_9PEZI|nr:hypothetical protein B0A55_02158 [Friedmanniomyces simplex]
MVLPYEAGALQDSNINTAPHDLNGGASHLPTQGPPIDPSVPRFNPTVPKFQPSGMDVALYAPPQPSIPPPSSHHYGLTEMERYTLDTNIRQASDIARLDYFAHRNRSEIELTNYKVERDLNELQSKLLQLRAEMRNDELTVVKRKTNLALEIAGPEKMLERHEPRIVAEVYIEHAELAEATAKKLREEVAKMFGGGERSAVDAGRMSIVVSVMRTNDEPSPERTAGPAEKSEPEVSTATPGKLVDSETQTEAWKPLAVRQMPPPPALNSPDTNKTTFTWEFLAKELRGSHWSPGFYFIRTASKIPSQTYWLLEHEWEPFLPSAPGQHGAKLSPLFNDQEFEPGQGPDVENYMDVPLFVRLERSGEYTYYGQYNQPRYSDKLDYDRVMETVPEKIRQRWADTLVQPDRPEWVTKALMEHFWPRPKYEGALPTDSAVASPTTAVEVEGEAGTVPLEKQVLRALTAYAEELKQWEKDAKMKVNHLSAKGIMEAFGKADADVEPGMRLWWEYLQCVGYKQEFYESLVQAQGIEQGKEKKRREMMARQGQMNAKGRAVTAEGNKHGCVKSVSGKAVPASTSGDTIRSTSAPTAEVPSYDYDSPVVHWYTPSEVAEPTTPTPNPPRSADTKEATPLTTRQSFDPISSSSENGKAKATVDKYGFPIVHHPYFDPVPAPTPQASSSKPDGESIGPTQFVYVNPPTGPKAKANGGMRKGDMEAAKRFQQTATKAGGKKVAGFGFGGGNGSGNGKPESKKKMQKQKQKQKQEREQREKQRKKQNGDTTSGRGIGKGQRREVDAFPEISEISGEQRQHLHVLSTRPSKPASRKSKKHGRKARAV